MKQFKKIFYILSALLLPVLGEEEAKSEVVTFKPTDIKAPFIEQFTSSWDSRWEVSHSKKISDTENDENLLQYNGKWAVEEPTVYKNIIGDKGLVVKSAAAHHAISSKFPTVIDNKGKTLVVQYEVKLQNELECGGAYLKLIKKQDEEYDPKKYNDKTPYVIMFGPDKCGSTNKVHFIFRHKNPLTGEYEEKHLESPPQAKIEKTTVLYTLIVRPDNSFEIKINNKTAKAGNLLEDFRPAVNPPKEIDDPEDKKPADWVDVAKIPDPEATKPEDWDEDAPELIPDEDAVKPDDWLDDEPEMIDDPEAEKPEDWDDEEDGEWVPVQIPNPKCESGNCGEWKRPMKKNPEFKGKWKAPLIDNPDYKGPWSPRKIPNPNYYEDNDPHNFEPMVAIGFELWTMQNQIMFDNIYIGHSEADAEEFANQTWAIKNKIEMVEYEKNDAKEKEEMLKGNDEGFKEKLALFIDEFKKDPITTFKKNPLYGSIACIVVALPFLSLLLIIRPKRKSFDGMNNEKKVEDEDAQEKKVEAGETNNVEENVTSENLKQRTAGKTEDEDEEEKKEEKEDKEEEKEEKKDEWMNKWMNRLY